MSSRRPFFPEGMNLKKGLTGSNIRSAFGIGIIVTVFVIVALGLYMVEIFTGLPSLEDLENPRPDLSTRIYSADGQQLDQFFVHNRTYIPYDSIPKSFIKALIATEDRKFYDHWGVDVERIIKAFVKNITSLDMTGEGASTITQQLARNLYLSREVTVNRKLREQITAVQIERTYTKNEILEMYANTVYFGRGAYGLQVASEIFFGKPPLDLTTDECAVLVGILKSPENYNPEHNYERSVLRRNTVMALMQQMGYITGADFQELSQKSIELTKQKRRSSVSSHFIEAIRQALSKEPKLQQYNLYRDGLVIYTTLDSRMQRYANQAVREHLAEFQPTFNRTWTWNNKGRLLQSLVERAARQTSDYKEALSDDEKAKVLTRLSKDRKFIDSVKKTSTEVEVGFIAIESKTGYVRALVGGSDPTEGRGLNHVTQIRRQPGSSFKPFVYASALQQGMNPGSPISTDAVAFRTSSGEVWSPKGGSGGTVPLASALKYSINTAAARLITEKTSPAKVVKLAKEMGIKSPIPEYYSIALGTAEVTPYELTAAYATFPNKGVFVEPTMILKVEDRWGNVIYEAPRIVHDALSPRIADQMVGMMRGVVDGGTASSIRRWFSYPAAGKTGTTQDFADAWFVGYTPELVAGTWVGFDDHRVKFTGWYGQGGKAAAPIWARFMAMVYKDDRLPYQEHNFPNQPIYSSVPYSLDEIPLENSAVPDDALEIAGPDESGTVSATTLDEPTSSTPDKPTSPSDFDKKDVFTNPKENEQQKNFGGGKPK